MPPSIILKSKYSKSIRHTTNHIEYINKQGALFSPDSELVACYDAVADAMRCQDSQVWMQMMSLNRSDFERLALDKSYFQNLLTIKRAEIARTYNINPRNLRLYASLHNKDYHPHVHLVFWSTDKREGFLRGEKGATTKMERAKGMREASYKLKGILGSEIFRGDRLDLETKKTSARDDLNRALERELIQATKNEKLSPETLVAYRALSKELRAHFETNGGRKAYGYLPPELKLKIDDLLEKSIMSSPSAKSLFDRYAETQHKLTETYTQSKTTLRNKQHDWQQSFFHPGKGDDTKRHNLIVQSIMGGEDGYQAKSSREAAKSLVWAVSHDIGRDVVRQKEIPRTPEQPKPGFAPEKQKRVAVGRALGSFQAPTLGNAEQYKKEFDQAKRKRGKSRFNQKSKISEMEPER